MQSNEQRENYQKIKNNEMGEKGPSSSNNEDMDETYIHKKMITEILSNQRKRREDHPGN